MKHLICTNSFLLSAELIDVKRGQLSVKRPSNIALTKACVSYCEVVPSLLTIYLQGYGATLTQQVHCVALSDDFNREVPSIPFSHMT